jgi:Pyruvate/2-oxoacid:ferredoxin oxidoreductase delta subunit
VTLPFEEREQQIQSEGRVREIADWPMSLLTEVYVTTKRILAATQEVSLCDHCLDFYPQQAIRARKFSKRGQTTALCSGCFRDLQKELFMRRVRPLFEPFLESFTKAMLDDGKKDDGVQAPGQYL